jgi:hypothetical protein
MGQIVSFDDYKPPARFDGIPWAEVEIQESADGAAPWTVIDTVALTPLDVDPASPQTRSFTTANGTAPDLWYRVAFIDGAGGRSNPTEPIHNSPDGPPARFATADDLATRLGLTLTTAEQTRANTLLADASGLIADHAKQQIALVADDELTMPGTTDDRIRLPERPVVSVASITLDGQTLGQGKDWYLNGDEIIRLSSMYVQNGGLDAMLDAPYLLGRSFGWPGQKLVIVYTHGYTDDALPKLVKSICLEMVVRVWVNPGSVARETVGNTATVYDNMRFSPSGLLLTDTEKKELRRFFGARARSIQIGG